MGLSDNRCGGERTDDEGVFGQRRDGHDDGERERAAGKFRGLQYLRVCARDEQRDDDDHGDISDQRGRDHDEQRGVDVQLKLQWDVHAGNGEQCKRELYRIHDTECDGIPALSDTEHGNEWV